MSLIKLDAAPFLVGLVNSLTSDTMAGPVVGSDFEACLDGVEDWLGLRSTGAGAGVGASAGGVGFDPFVSAAGVPRTFLFYRFS